MSISLAEKRIMITREEHQAKYFSNRVKAYGGIPVVVPLLKITGIDNEKNKRILRQLTNYLWIFFTSANGVHYFFELLHKYNMDTSLLKYKKIAVVGHKTENELRKFGFAADFIPSIYDADTMSSEFLDHTSDKGPILLVRGNRSRDVLPHMFIEQGMNFDCITVYETVYNYPVKEQLNEVLKEETIDFITFTSPSTVEAFVEMAIEKVDNPCVCIGTTTEKKARDLRFNSLLTPKEFTVDAMIELMSEYIAIGKDR